MKKCARRQGLRRRQVRACRWLESEDTGAADCEGSWLEEWTNTQVVGCSGGAVFQGGEAWRGMFFFCGSMFFSFDTTWVWHIMLCQRAKQVSNSPCKCACV